MVGLLPCLALAQVRPPNYSPDLLPDTSFTCEDKVGCINVVYFFIFYFLSNFPSGVR